MAVFLSQGVPLERCTGTMVAAKVFLTAAHCAGFDPNRGVAPDRAEVWFSSGPIPAGTYAFDGTPCKASDTGFPCKGEFTGTPVAHPGWDGFLTFPNTHDIGVVRLSQAPDVGITPIAPAAYLDKLATQRGLQNVNFTVVGYGVQFERPNLESALRQRFVATNQLQSLNSHLAGGFTLTMSDSNGAGTGGGGICFGDSGGPVLHTDGAGKTWEVAVISSATKYCNGKSTAFRLDTAEARTFLADHGVELN